MVIIPFFVLWEFQTSTCIKQTNKKTCVSNSEELGSNLLCDSGIHLLFIKPSISSFVTQELVGCKH